MPPDEIVGYVAMRPPAVAMTAGMDVLGSVLLWETEAEAQAWCDSRKNSGWAPFPVVRATTDNTPP